MTAARTDVEFEAEGVTLRGWLYRPDVPGPAPAVVMAHGFSGVKEHYLDRFAEVFAAAGLAVLVFDHRNFGASDGAPRHEIDPVRQARDYRDAVTFVRALDGIDPARIGVWSTSYSGGHALAVGAHDRRVGCVVAQVPTISGPQAALRRVRPDLVPALLARLDADREARFRGAPPGVLPVVAPDPSAPAALPGTEAWAFFEGVRAQAPLWRNEVTLRSVEHAREYEPGVHIARISPTPLLMVVATHDTLTPTDLALEAYGRALEPKRLMLVRGGHFTPYLEGFGVASAAARDWFVEHLAARL
jgi:fermentation-respiration switch protein FrsA (DUF1100 family)